MTDATPEHALSPSVPSAAPAQDRETTDRIFDALATIYDPEIGIDIVSLGLVYGASLAPEGVLTVEMTLTSPYCPLGDVIETQARAICGTLPGVTEVEIQFVWTPPWDPRTMASDEARLQLGIY